VEADGVPFIKHYLIDFGSMLGSDSDAAKDVRLGHRYMLEKDRAVPVKMFTAGLWIEDWERADYGGIRSVGRITAEAFHPDRWTPNYPNPAFLNRLPDDDFWGAKQVVNFTNNEIRAVLETGEYTDPRAVDYLASVLIKRRDAIGREFFSQVLPLDRFEVRDGALQWHDLWSEAGFGPGRQYSFDWARFDNATGSRAALTAPAPPPRGARAAPLPPDARNGYVVLTIRCAEVPLQTVSVYVRADKVVGVDRTW